MTDVVQGLAGRPAESKSLKAWAPLGKEEYRFYEFPHGNPPGQIKAFVRTPPCSSERRVPFGKLPTPALQRTFLALTGKTACEIGVALME